jgi:hypothetical protein
LYGRDDVAHCCAAMIVVTGSIGSGIIDDDRDFEELSARRLGIGLTAGSRIRISVRINVS